MFKALGHPDAKFEGLETFPRPDTVERVQLICDEVTAVCPIIDQPDYYVVTITYWPVERCVETKSLKLYLQQFRNEGIFCESFAARITSDIMQALAPHACQVDVQQKSRGGISIIATAFQGDETCRQ
jgi:7-cyano-7-deazaguanine reductase